MAHKGGVRASLDPWFLMRSLLQLQPITWSLRLNLYSTWRSHHVLFKNFVMVVKWVGDHVPSNMGWSMCYNNFQRITCHRVGAPPLLNKLWDKTKSGFKNIKACVFIIIRGAPPHNKLWDKFKGGFIWF